MSAVGLRENFFFFLRKILFIFHLSLAFLFDSPSQPQNLGLLRPLSSLIIAFHHDLGRLENFSCRPQHWDTERECFAFNYEQNQAIHLWRHDNYLWSLKQKWKFEIIKSTSYSSESITWICSSSSLYSLTILKLTHDTRHRLIYKWISWFLQNLICCRWENSFRLNIGGSVMSVYTIIWHI